MSSKVKDYGHLITDIGVYRRQHHISSVDKPLGETSEHGEYQQLSRVLDQWMQARETERNEAWQAASPEQQKPETSASWTQYESGAPSASASASAGAGAGAGAA